MPMETTAVMSELDTLCAELTAICQALREEVMDGDSVRADVDAAEEMLQRVPPFAVVVCGEYGRGKSTLLSALARRRRLFPHDPDDTTSVATTLAWGSTESAVVSFAGPDGSLRDSTIDISDVQRYVTEIGNRGIPVTVVGVKIQAPLDTLAWGLELTDTPGVNSRNPAHNLITRQYLERAGLILFVASTDGPLSELELGWFDDAVRTGALIIPVLAKADGDVADPDIFLRSAQERLTARLGRSVEVLPVAAEMALDGQEDHDIVLEDESGVPELYRQLTAAGTARKARYLLRSPDTAQGDAGSPVGLLASAVTTLQTGAANELATIKRAEDEHKTFAHAITDARRQLRRLEAAASEFRLEVHTRVNEMVGEIQKRVSDSCESLIQQTKLDQAMAKPTVRPAAYLNGLVQRLGVIANQADASLEQFLHGVVEEVRKFTEAEFTYLPALSSGTLLPTGGPAAPGRRKRISFDAVREGILRSGIFAGYAGSVGGGVGMLIASAPGAAVGAAVGALIGHIAGVVVGTRAAMDAQDATDIQQIARAAPSWIEDSAKMINVHLAESAPAEIDRLSKTVDGLIGQRRTQLRIQQEQARSNGAADRAGRAARSAELAAQLVTLERLRSALTRVGEQLQVLAGD
jgi:GTPase SAR1 family protein